MTRTNTTVTFLVLLLASCEMPASLDNGETFPVGDDGWQTQQRRGRAQNAPPQGDDTEATNSPPVVIGPAPQQSKDVLEELAELQRLIKKTNRQVRGLKKQPNNKLKSLRAFVSHLHQANHQLEHRVDAQSEDIRDLEDKVRQLQQDAAERTDVEEEAALRLETALLLQMNEKLFALLESNGQAMPERQPLLRLENQRADKIRVLVALRDKSSQAVYAEAALVLAPGQERCLGAFLESDLKGTEVFLSLAVDVDGYWQPHALEELMPEFGFPVTLGDGAEERVALVPDTYRGKKTNLSIYIGPSGLTTN